MTHNGECFTSSLTSLTSLASLASRRLPAPAGSRLPAPAAPPQSRASPSLGRSRNG